MPDPSAAVFPRQPAELIQLAAAHFAGLFNGKLFVAHARESRQRTTPGTSMDALDLDYGLATGALVGPMSAEGPAPVRTGRRSGRHRAQGCSRHNARDCRKNLSL
eukprot:CAMPEP_0204038932 /NCGR_PEP_ID=MMETSP0360-20130528/89412_1 /ASSEMBLY_ACC=CAM_ASM_000342 /TAXON_ID=268821 /ORGANISM="Scrippsiella Hangoei, Strain SHTV-5" /LENGTH=104 /DNA_ID=CAMNT_0050984735 /DNA_START=197 /DNA_END=508 /DNA_ORIENTATION=-